MTAQENYELAEAYLTGKNGLQPDKAKGMEYLKAAALEGHKAAVVQYAKETMATDGAACVDMLKKISLDELKNDDKEVYIRALSFCAHQAPERKAECLAIGETLVNEPYKTVKESNLAYAELLAIAAPERADEIIARYSNAAIDASWYTVESNYLKYNQQILSRYGFDPELVSVEMMRPHEEVALKNELAGGYESTKFKGHVNRYAKIKKSLNFIQEILKQQFAGAKPEAARALNDAQWQALKGEMPEPVLIYEKLRGKTWHIGEADYRFSHQASDSITRTTGNGTLYIDETYGVYEACYLCETKDEDLMAYINKLEYAEFSEIPANALLRAGKKHKAGDSKDTLTRRMLNAADAVIKEEACHYLHKQYAWHYSDISISCGSSFDEEWDKAVYVPYYYFLYTVNGVKVTVRVNAFDGAVTYFVGNEYGQIQTAEEKKAAQQQVQQGKKFKGWMIPIIIGGGLIVLAIVTEVIKALMS